MNTVPGTDPNGPDFQGYIPGGYNPNITPNMPNGQSQSGQLGGQGGGTNGGGGLFGNSNNPGALGTGQYVAPSYNIQLGAFNNPNFTPGAYNQAAAGFLGNTTGGVQAAASPYTAQGAQGQLGLAHQYAQMAAGNGPSLANVQAQQQGAQNLAGAESMLGSARGAGSPAAAQLAAQQAQAMGGQQVAQNAVQGRTAEELAAMQAQGGLLGSVAGTGLAQQGQQNMVAQGNQANNLAAQTSYLGSLGAQGLQQQEGQIQGQQLGVQQQLGLDQVQQQAYAAAAKGGSNLIGSALSGLGALGGVML